MRKLLLNIVICILACSAWHNSASAASIEEVKTSVTKYLARIPDGSEPGEAGKALLALPPEPALTVLVDVFKTSKSEIMTEPNKRYIFLTALATFDGANHPVARKIMVENQADPQVGWFITKKLTGVNPLNDAHRANALLTAAQSTSSTRDQNIQILMSARSNSELAKQHLNELRAIAIRAENDNYLNTLAYRALANAEDYAYLLDLVERQELPNSRSEIYRSIRLSTINNGCKVTDDVEFLERMKQLILREQAAVVRSDALMALSCFLKSDPHIGDFLSKVELDDKDGEVQKTIQMLRDNI